MRFFFDIFTQPNPVYDFHGNYFSRPEDAAQHAALIAAGLGCSETESLAGSKVQVRNATGAVLFAVPILIEA
jgi:hypothetical protein